MQLDKEYRELTAYLTSIAGWTIREKCSKLSQIVSLLNAESVEDAVDFLRQLKSGSIVTTILSQNDIRKTLSLRLDFPKEVITHISTDFR